MGTNNSEKYWKAKSATLASILLYKLGRKPELPYYTTIIAEIAKQMKPSVYLEIGVFQCATFNEVSKYSKIALGSDLEDSSKKFFSLENQNLILGDIQMVAGYLSSNKLSVDLVFIDANHEKDYVVGDFVGIQPFLSKNALVIFHDTYPGTSEQTSQEFCGDAYLAIPELRRMFSGYSFVTLPIHPGLTFATCSSDLPLWVE